jgi:hypothetical protein
VPNHLTANATACVTPSDRASKLTAVAIVILVTAR